ncbi:long-chain-fatty-acid--CoA ligase [Candidatus Dependentiae bacterium Noda2021]|nr:long-chain-fatty-acid--CoA ligase [Candidatus Dependentiae bacterium Noda2021]
MSNHSERAVFDSLYQSIQVHGAVMPVGGLLQRAAQKFPERTALVFQDKPITFKHLYYQAINFSKFLAEKGLKAQERVLLFIENSPFFYNAYFAAAQLGAVVVPLNTFLSEQELEHIINDSKPALIITTKTLVDRVNAKSHGIATITDQEVVLPTDVPSTLPDFVIEKQNENAMAVLLYTSGTTGLPKGVMLSSKNIMTNVLQVVARVGITGEERVFGILPLFHSFAQNICIWSSFFLGAAVILLPKIDRRSIYAGLAQKPTVIVGVPALYGLFCLFKNLNFENVKYFVSGGDALPDKIRAGFEILYGRKICNGYGMTEASPVIAAELEDIRLATSTIGKPMVRMECAIRDANNSVTLPPFHIGQICVKGDNVMLGYYNAQEATNAILQDGWLQTGDLGYLDESGRIVISGRVKDLIAHKGFKIYPQEIENVLMGHPLVMNVGVIGVKQVDVGEIPVAYVQVKECTDALQQELLELCRKKLAPYKIPKQFVCTVEPLPVTTTNKVDKKVLRKKHQ